MNERSPAAVLVGLVYVVASVLLLLAAIGVWRAPLAVAGPAAVVAFGIAVVLGGLHRRWPRRPGPKHVS